MDTSQSQQPFDQSLSHTESLKKPIETPMQVDAEGTKHTDPDTAENQIVDKPGKADEGSSDSEFDLQVLEELLQDQAFLELPKTDGQDKDESHNAKADGKNTPVEHSESEESKHSSDEEQNGSEDSPQEKLQADQRKIWQGGSDHSSDDAKTYSHLDRFKTQNDVEEFFQYRKPVQAGPQDPRSNPKSYTNDWRSRQPSVSPYKKRRKTVSWVNSK